MADQAIIEFDAKQWEEFLKKLQSKISSPQSDKQFLGILSANVFQDIQDHFEKEQGPNGKWVNWSRLYADHLQKIGRSGNKILQFSGKLRQSFVPSNYRSTTEGVMFYNNAVTKSGFPYAAAHDEGGPKLPKRSFMWFSNKAMDKTIQELERWLADG